MKAGWQRRNLGDVCSFVRGPFGGSLKKEIFVPKGFAVYEQQHAIYNQFDQIRYFIDENKFSEMERFELRANDLIMSCSGTMGKVAVVPEEIKQGIINQALLKLTPSKAIHSFFLKHWMDSQDFQEMLKEQAGGAAIQNVASVSILKEIKIPLPSFEEQRRIVTLLDEAFADIATAKANAKKNLQNARDFFAGQLQAVFDSGIDNWNSSTLGQVYDVRDGTHDSPKYHDEGFPLITSKNLKNEGLTFDDVKLISLEDYNKINERSAVHQGDILLAMIGTIGNPTVVETIPNFAIKNVALLKVPENQNNYFLRYYLSSPSVIAKMQAEAKGTTQKFVGLGYLRAFPISVPELSEQEQIVRKLDELRTETNRLEAIYRQKITALDDLKKSLLYQAFSGQL